MSESFNPQDYLTQISGKDYLEVKWRLFWFRTENPDGVIETELKRDDGKSALFAARVSKSAAPDAGSATGWGSETEDDFHDYVEKAETKAVGRALAALGYGTQYAYDLEEVTPEQAKSGRVPRIVDAPVRLPTPARVQSSVGQGQAPAQGFDRPTDKMLKYLKRLGAVGEFGGSGEPDWREWSKYTGIRDDDLTGPEVKRAIEFFLDREKNGLTGTGDLPPFLEVIGRRAANDDENGVRPLQDEMPF